MFKLSGSPSTSILHKPAESPPCTRANRPPPLSAQIPLPLPKPVHSTSTFIFRPFPAVFEALSLPPPPRSPKNACYRQVEVPTMFKTTKQRAASRANSQKSTGPRTAEGKAVSRFNALKHAIFAVHQIMF